MTIFGFNIHKSAATLTPYGKGDGNLPLYFYTPGAASAGSPHNPYLSFLGEDTMKRQLSYENR